MDECCVDLIFADPPYFLSNGGITCRAGRMVSVYKGAWDQSRGAGADHQFNRRWLAACRRVLRPDGAIWVSGTSHVIHSVGFAMQQLGFKLLNDVTWVKPNPPPNLSCRYFTHATETIVWAAKCHRSRHVFNYALMKDMAGGKQMKSVWSISPAGRKEKSLGSYPTQKPLALLERVLLATSNPGDTVLDPFMGSGTTLVAAQGLLRRAIGVELEAPSVALALARLCSDAVSATLAVSTSEMNLDGGRGSVDRSVRRPGRNSGMQIQARLVRRECSFYFVGNERREVVYSAVAENFEDAWQKFRDSAAAGIPVLFVIKTETEIYLTLGT
ncbi:MAG TPA: site-specific DNA-methyltransferase [Candidatus Acidoferrales bacterium]|nr:site-specific DNA-methyltransferase [Candidatus Acidoferrales bacterium]